MRNLKVHFFCEPGKKDISDFVGTLIAQIGQADFKEADIVVSIGGDGSLLHVLRRAANGQKVFGLVPPGSNSRGFWTNNIIQSADHLLEKLAQAEGFKISPLKAVIKHRDGAKTLLKAFNEVAPCENSGQAMLIELAIKRPSKRSRDPIRVMGDGLILSTAFGSTALNRTYGGPAMDIRNSGIAIVGKGIYEPQGFGSIIADDEEIFEIHFKSPDKRPVRVLYDGHSKISLKENPFETMAIEKDKNFAVELLLTEDPSTRTFSSIIPRI